MFKSYSDELTNTVENYVEEGINSAQPTVEKYTFLSTCLVSVLGSLASIFMYTRYFRNKDAQKASFPGQKKSDEQYTKQNQEKVESIWIDILRDNYDYFNVDNQDKIREAFVVVVGVGGVGSHTINCLVRNGIKKLRIIDFDLISTSSLNRMCFSFEEDVGEAKVDVVKKYLLKLNPVIDVETFKIKLDDDNMDELLKDKPDYLIDCIDDQDTKTTQLQYCYNNKIKVISSGGAGMKADPTKIKVNDISCTSYDDLTKTIRHRLHANKIYNGIPFIYSDELTKRKLLELQDHQKENVDQFRPLDRMRVRIVPVLGTMPSLFGCSLAAYVQEDIGQNKKFDQNAVNDMAKFNVYMKIQDKLMGYVTKKNLQHKINFDIEDVYFVCRDICNWKSVISGKESNSLELFVWDLDKDISGKNLILVTREESKSYNEKRDKLLREGNDQWAWCKNLQDNKLYEKLELHIKESKKRYERAFPIFTNLSKNKI